MFDFNVCFPGKAAGLFGFGWPLLPGIVAELARWRLRTWPDVNVHEALLFMAATKEAGDASARVAAALRDLKTWLPGPDAAGQPLFGSTIAQSDQVQQDHSQPLLLRDVLQDGLEGRQAQMFTGCGTGRLHLFPAQELYSREELHDVREDVGPWGHTPSQDRPATLQLLIDCERRVSGLWG